LQTFPFFNSCLDEGNEFSLVLVASLLSRTHSPKLPFLPGPFFVIAEKFPFPFSHVLLSSWIPLLLPSFVEFLAMWTLETNNFRAPFPCLKPWLFTVPCSQDPLLLSSLLLYSGRICFKALAESFFETTFLVGEGFTYFLSFLQDFFSTI